MPSRSIPLLLALFAVACEPDTGPPTGGDDSEQPDALPDCPGAWTEHDDGVWLQPSACLAWSLRAVAPMDWYAAVSPDEAVAGGCGQYCDDEPGYCAQLDAQGGISDWRLPSRRELEGAGESAPPLEPLDEALWSRDSSGAVESMAHQVKLSTPELEYLVGKEQDGWVRCVVDL